MQPVTGIFLPLPNCDIRLQIHRSGRSTPWRSQPRQPGSKHNIQPARQAYYDKISKFHMAPLWEVLKDLVTPEPKTQCRPALWKFADVKKLMLEAGDVITAEEAERRVLVLENPGDAAASRASPIRCSPASS